jgi:subtilisin family serine protease
MLRYLLLVIVFIFFGCSGGGGSNTSNITASQEVSSTLIDSGIAGVSYICADKSGLTDIDGKFVCDEGTTVYFSIGGISLGSAVVRSSDTYITPAKVFGLLNNNITDIRILNFIQLLQSLDSDNNASNGIDINQTIRDSFASYSLDLSDVNLTEEDINSTVKYVGKNLVDQMAALEHYVTTLNEILDIVFVDEPYYYQQWYLDKNTTFYLNNNIDENAHIATNKLTQVYTGKGITVAVIDDGLDVTHEDLEGVIVSTFDSLTKGSNVAHTQDSDFHGTSVTGIIGARVNGKGIQGVASKADIIFLKYQNLMTDSETIELFNKAEELGADVINCSWGTYNVSDAVKERIQTLSNDGRDGKGISIVFATGNDYKSTLGNDESAIPEVISVGASNKDNVRAAYSNYGDNLDVVAPGGFYLGITTLDSSGMDGNATLDEDYLLYNDSNYFIGTSASAPIVTGIIALMLEKNPNLTREEIETILKNNADKIGAIPYTDGKNDEYGYGKVNLSKVLESL